MAPLFQLEVHYRRGDTLQVQDILDLQRQMHSMILVMIGCASLSMVLVAVLGFLYLRKRRAMKRGTDILDSLVGSAENDSAQV